MINIKERLIANRKIDLITGCWLWQGHKDHGYGRISYQGKKERVHRLAYIEFKGPLKNLALHLNSCPHKHCFNPDHLYDGTGIENLRDSKEKLGYGPDIGHSVKTHCPQGHPYSGDNLIQHKNKNKRECRICMNLSGKLAMRKKRGYQGRIYKNRKKITKLLINPFNGKPYEKD